MNPAGVPAIRAVALAKSFPVSWRGRRRPVLADVAVTVAAGSVCALVGPNGAGKSTLLRILAGLTCPDSGLVEIAGLAPRAAARAGVISYLPDAPEWPPGSCLLELLDLGVRILGCPAGDALEALTAVGLAQFGTHRVGECSRGQRQRIGLAWASLGHPGVILLDEPFSGLDPRAAVEGAQVVRRLAESGAAVLFSSHFLAEAEELADFSLLLHRGRLAFAGNRTEVAAEGGLRQIFLSRTEP
jgi:ABC-2 type transport system ATP-binding protein